MTSDEYLRGVGANLTGVEILRSLYFLNVFGIAIRVMMVSKSKMGSILFPLIFSESLCRSSTILSLNIWKNSAVNVPGLGVFFVRRVLFFFLTYKFNFFNKYSY